MERKLLGSAKKRRAFTNRSSRIRFICCCSVVPLLIAIARPCSLLAYDMGGNPESEAPPAMLMAQSDIADSQANDEDSEEGPSADDLLNESGMKGRDEEPSADDLLNESGMTTGQADQTPPGEGNRIPFHYEGELRANVLAPVSESSPHTTNRLDLKGWGALGDVNMQGLVKFDYQDLEESGKFRIDLRELYAEYRFHVFESGYMNFCLGKKIVTWGKGDEVRPLDRVSPQDLTSLYFYDICDRKTGRVGVFLDIDMYKDIRFEGFWSPYFEASETPGPGDFFEPAALRQLTDAGVYVGCDIEPSKWSTSAGFGGRLMFSLFKTDIDLYAFQGYDPSPTYIVNKLGLASGYNLPIVPQSVVAIYPRITFFGADMERAVGSYVLRAEAMYQTKGAFFTLDWAHDPTLLLNNPNGVIEKRQLQYLVGLDKNDFLTHNLFLNFQFFGRYIFDHDSDMVAPASLTGITATVRYSCLDSRLEMKYRCVVVLDENDQRHQFQIAGKITNWAQLTLGYTCYSGDADSNYFGQYSDLDYVYGQLRLVF